MLINLRFALNVLEERSHIGLNDDRAASIRCLLLKRIVEAEKVLGHKPTTQPCKEPTRELALA
jgi:hypothetical protein